eukprot:SAG31_NODE_501_length_14835_cov_11.191979_7_plen_182_part_00
MFPAGLLPALFARSFHLGGGSPEIRARAPRAALVACMDSAIACAAGGGDTLITMLISSQVATALLAALASPTAALSLFFRTSWAHEVPTEVLESWFQLIAKGKAEGPTSPYYVDFLAIQSIACSQQSPLGPPCNTSAPSGAHQPVLQNESMSCALLPLPRSNYMELTDDLINRWRYFRSRC